MNHCEYFSLPKTLDFILSNRKKIDWYQVFELDEIEVLKAEVEKLEEEKLLGIETFRNKRFAHLDKNKEKFEYNFRLLDAYEVIEKSQNVYRRLLFHFDGSGVVFSIWKNPPKEIIALSKYHQKRKQLLEYYLQNNWSKELESLWMIIRN